MALGLLPAPPLDLMAKHCPICGTENQICGGGSEPLHVIGGPSKAAEYTGPLHVYEVEPGVTLQLREDEAREKYGLEPSENAAKKKAPAKNKKRTPAENK